MKNVEVGQLISPVKFRRSFANEFLNSDRALDLLILNTGLYTPLMRDARGYEMQFATNHLGHFQLTTVYGKRSQTVMRVRPFFLRSC
jgi:NAD(P)-dependent dehydrogenase (short-subunit alcohol dehydrogenase family)